jgi:hypothetical protein
VNTNKLKEAEYKMSSKGIQKKAHPLNPSVAHMNFVNALEGGKVDIFINKGIRSDPSSSRMVMYSQQRDSITSLYVKRRVLHDGIHTVPISRTFYCGLSEVEKENRKRKAEMRQDRAKRARADADSLVS